ncbi:Actin patch protein 1 [Balamuthia mandrillaris]
MPKLKIERGYRKKYQSEGSSSSDFGYGFYEDSFSAPSEPGRRHFAHVNKKTILFFPTIAAVELDDGEEHGGSEPEVEEAWYDGGGGVGYGRRSGGRKKGHPHIHFHLHGCAFQSIEGSKRRKATLMFLSKKLGSKGEAQQKIVSERLEPFLASYIKGHRFSIRFLECGVSSNIFKLDLATATNGHALNQISLPVSHVFPSSKNSYIRALQKPSQPSHSRSLPDLSSRQTPVHGAHQSYAHCNSANSIQDASNPFLTPSPTSSRGHSPPSTSYLSPQQRRELPRSAPELPYAPHRSSRPHLSPRHSESEPALRHAPYASFDPFSTPSHPSSSPMPLPPLPLASPLPSSSPSSPVAYQQHQQHQQCFPPLPYAPHRMPSTTNNAQQSLASSQAQPEFDPFDEFAQQRFHQNNNNHSNGSATPSSAPLPALPPLQNNNDDHNHGSPLSPRGPLSPRSFPGSVAAPAGRYLQPLPQYQQQRPSTAQYHHRPPPQQQQHQQQPHHQHRQQQPRPQQQQQPQQLIQKTCLTEEWLHFELVPGNSFHSSDDLYLEQHRTHNRWDNDDDEDDDFSSPSFSDADAEGGWEEGSVRGRVLLVEEEGISLISDIDDTIKFSFVADKKELLKNTFLREFVAVEGMAPLYRRWQRLINDCPDVPNRLKFHYVSGSPYQLYRPLALFLWGPAFFHFPLSSSSSDHHPKEEKEDESRFPQGSVHLKNVAWNDKSLFKLFEDKLEYKLNIIEPELFRRFPKRKFILVGDSSEQDPEVYSALAWRYPHQVIAIFIRRAPISASSSSEGEASLEAKEMRWQQMFAGLEQRGIVWRVFSDPSELEEIDLLSLVRSRLQAAQ